MTVWDYLEQPLFINKNDWNPKLIVIIRDIYGNLVTTKSAADLQFNYQFDLVRKTDANAVLRSGKWE